MAVGVGPFSGQLGRFLDQDGYRWSNVVKFEIQVIVCDPVHIRRNAGDAMIKTECDICRNKFRFEDDFAGSIVRCRECRAEFEVPVRSLWENFAEANPEMADAAKWTAQGVVGVLTLLGLTIGAFELAASMDEDAGPREANVPARQRPAQPAAANPTLTPVDGLTASVPTVTAQTNTPPVETPLPAIPATAQTVVNASNIDLDDLLGIPARSELQCVAVIPDLSGLFSAHGTRQVQRNGLPGLELVKTLGFASGRVTALTVTRDGRTLIGTTHAGEVLTWDVESGQQKNVFVPHSSAITGLALGRSPIEVLTASLDGTVKLTSFRSHAPVQQVPAGSPATHLAGTSQGRNVAMARLDGSVRVWDLARPTNVWEMTGPSPCRGLAISEDGRLLAVAGESEVKIHVIEDRRLTTTVPADGARIVRVTLSERGRFLSVGHGDGRVGIYDANTARSLFQNRLNSTIVALTFFPGNTHLLMASSLGSFEGKELDNTFRTNVTPTRSTAAAPRQPRPNPRQIDPPPNPVMQVLKQKVAGYPVAITSTVVLPGQPVRVRLTGRGFSDVTGMILLYSGNREFRPEYEVMNDSTIEATLNIRNGGRVLRKV